MHHEMLTQRTLFCIDSNTKKGMLSQQLVHLPCFIRITLKPWTPSDCNNCSRDSRHQIWTVDTVAIECPERLAPDLRSFGSKVNNWTRRAIQNRIETTVSGAEMRSRLKSFLRLLAV